MDYRSALEQAILYIEDRLGESITVEEVALAAGIRGTTTLKDNKLAELWQEFNKGAAQIPHRSLNGRAFGICEACQDNSVYTMSDEVSFTEVAGIEVDSFEGLPADFVRKVIPGGRYAVFTHTGSLRKLPQTFHYIWGTWLLNTSDKMDDREDFELYDHRYLGMTIRLRKSICIFRSNKREIQYEGRT